MYDSMAAVPKVGDTLEVSVWLTGTETLDEAKSIGETVKAELMNRMAAVSLVPGPIRNVFLRPGDSRVPPVPDHIHGPDVRLLVAEVDAVGRVPALSPLSFLGDLDPVDLARLRAVTRLAAGQRVLSDEECDRVIEALGPDTALKTLRDNVDGMARPN